MPSNDLHGVWTGLQITKGTDPRLSKFEQYRRRLMYTVLRMRKVVLEGYDYREKWGKGYGPKEHVMFFLLHLEKLNERGELDTSNIGPQRAGIKIVFGPDPTKTPLVQFSYRWGQMAVEMRDLMRLAERKDIARSYCHGFSAKEHLIWTVHQIDEINDEGTMTKKKKWARKKGIRILECLDGIPV